MKKPAEIRRALLLRDEVKRAVSYFSTHSVLMSVTI